MPDIWHIINFTHFSLKNTDRYVQDVPASVLPDPKLVADLATALGYVTVIHKGAYPFLI